MNFFKTAQGRSSIFLAIDGLARKNKKFIITQSFTCVAVPEAIIRSGYKPYWIDIELQTYSMDIEELKVAIEKCKGNFAAILVQFTYGLIPRYYTQIKQFARENKIPIIEDRCHCHFIHDYKNLILKNNKSYAYCYSFENAKPVKLGRGGLLIFNHKDEKVILGIKNTYKNFKNQSIFKSVLFFAIALAYILFRNTNFYWPLLDIYRNLAKKGFLPSNFKSTLKDLKFEKMGLIQSSIISFMKMNFEIRLSLSEKFKFLKFINASNKVFEYKFPLYVNNKKKAINYCKQNKIPVSDYFNSPIQPLSSDQFHKVNYQESFFKNAEAASCHIIVFDKKPKKNLIKIIQNL